MFQDVAVRKASDDRVDDVALSVTEIIYVCTGNMACGPLR
jgi:hypothetical protein